jgi:hypothetical protein
MDRLHPSREYTQGAMADKKQFSNTKSIVKVETGIATLISDRHYLKIVEASAREIATCKQNVGQKEDFMHSNFQMDISLPWIDAAFT